MKKASVVLLVPLLTLTAAASEPPQLRAPLVSSVARQSIETPWRPGSSPAAALLGESIAIVFSPDLTTPENRAFYETIGFTYFDTARWTEVLSELERRQSDIRAKPIRYLIVESHGANGNGLKLQVSKDPMAVRSYISIGAIQEAADKLEIETVIISACNAGRLFRPGIYKMLDRDPGDELFLPPTAGIVDAGAFFRPEQSSTRVLRRKQSNLETLVEGKFTELPLWLRERLADAGNNDGRFVVSTMLIQLALGDPTLELTSDGFEVDKSRANLTPRASELLFQRFVRFLKSSPPPEDAAERLVLR